MDFQGSLFGTADVEAPTFDRLERRQLTRGAWVDVCPAWLPEADEVFATMVRDVPWHAERRQMYDREVDVPRLLSMYGAGDPLPHPA
ncbi:alpha-ketoglutarate-dependent dioxygenase AlkB, partial [Nocardioides hankookensis]